MDKPDIRDAPAPDADVRGDTPPAASEYERRGYVCARRLLEPSTVDELWAYVWDQWRTQQLPALDPAVPGTPSVYADTRMEQLLAALRPQVEAISGHELYETYSYYRLYKHGDRLRRHIDRPSCEVSVTLNLGQEPDDPWPFGIEGRLETAVIELQPGDGLIYSGVDCAHWREAFPGRRLAQVFLHYVKRHGPRQRWKYDRRQALKLS